MIPVILYFVGLALFGFSYYLLNGILDVFIAIGYHQTGSAYTLLMAIWTAGLFLYLIFGGLWLMKIYNEKQYQGGL